MYLKTFVPLLLAGSAAASYAEYWGQEVPEAPQDGTEIGKFMGDLATQFNNLDAVLTSINKENVASSGEKLLAQGQKFNTMLQKNAQKIKSSKKLSSLFSVLPLISKVSPLISAVNKTLQHTALLQPLANESGLSIKFRDGLMASEPGIVAVTAAIIGNIDLNALLPAPKAGKDKDGNPTPAQPRPQMPPITEDAVKPIVDGIIETGVGLFNGTIKAEDLQKAAGALFAKAKGKKKGDGSSSAPAAPAAMSTPGADAPAHAAAGGHGDMAGMAGMAGMNMKVASEWTA